MCAKFQLFWKADTMIKNPTRITLNTTETVAPRADSATAASIRHPASCQITRCTATPAPKTDGAHRGDSVTIAAKGYQPTGRDREPVPGPDQSGSTPRDAGPGVACQEHGATLS